jgi:hypothetical protein
MGMIVWHTGKMLLDLSRVCAFAGFTVFAALDAFVAAAC